MYNVRMDDEQSRDVNRVWDLIEEIWDEGQPLAETHDWQRLRALGIELAEIAERIDKWAT